MTYTLKLIDHRPFTARLQAVRISASLRITPEPSQSKGWRSSGLSSCLRQTGYRLAKTPETDDPYVETYKLQADMGTAIHARLQAQAVAAGLVLDYPGFGSALELPLSVCCASDRRADLERWHLTGHIDGIVRMANGELAIWDVKTTEPKYMDPESPWLAKKLQGYAVQLSSYLWAFATPDGIRANTAFIYLVNRGNTDHRLLYRLDWQPDRWAVDAARLNAAVQAVAAGELPIAEPARGVCRFCAYRTLCEGSR